jgi:hypothetical protein
LADRWTGFEPALTIAGAFIGAGAGFYYLFHELTKATREQNERRDSNDQ